MWADVKDWIEYVVMQVIAWFTIEGTYLRSLWVFLARYSMRTRRWLFLRDTWELIHRETIPGEVVLEWADQRSAQSMAEQIVEHIRKAPRAYSITHFILEVGELDVERTGMLDGVWNENALSIVTQFLTEHAPAKNRAVRLMLLGSVLAAVKQRYRWSA